MDLNIDNMIETILDKDGFSCQSIFNFSERVAAGDYGSQWYSYVSCTTCYYV